MKNGLVLSLFPGADLFGIGFELEGFCVVRGPDRIWGGDVANFFPPVGVLEGIIGGPPCPDWSGLRRTPQTGQGIETLYQFIRITAHAKPLWFVMENVVGVPDIEIPGYKVRLCVCGCGRPVPDGRTMATDACRQRMKRRRDAAGVTGPGPVTTGQSQLAFVADNITKNEGMELCSR